MKKLLIALLILIISLTLSVAIILFVFEDQIVDTFKKQIIDKTNINLNYSKIHLSLFKNFPLCSFVLNDASILYSSEKGSDTLLFSKNLRFKINAINIFRSIYEFPEIVVSDGKINIIKEKLDLLFPTENVNKKPNLFLIKTERIKITKCLIKYSNGDKVNIIFHLRNVSCSGSFLSNSLALRLNFDLESLTGIFKNYKLNSNNQLRISTTIKEKNNSLFSEHGTIKFNAIELGFSFNYSFKDDFIQATLSANDISIKELKQPVFDKVNKLVSKGVFSFNSYYTANINDLKSQKISISYELNKFSFFINKSLYISNLKGTTTFLGNIENNTSVINRFSLNYSGMDFMGSARIKELPHPYISVDATIKNTRNIILNKNLTLNGIIKGDLKFLVKLNNVYNLNDSTINIIKLSSQLKLSNLSIENNDNIKSLTGDLQINENSLNFTGNGILLNSSFNGEIEIPNFLNVCLHNQSPSPKVSLNIDRLNLDSVLRANTKNTDNKLPINFFLKGKVKSLIYKSNEINNLGLVLSCTDGQYRCDRFSMNVFSGNLTGNFSYSLSDGANYSFIFQNIDIHQLFKTFNNFEQKIITSENIQGSLSGKANVFFKYEKSGKVNPLSLKVSSELLIEKGVFHDLSQFNRLSKFLNLKEVESIQFKTLENNINIEDGVVTIPLMKISSSALNFQLTGQHKFNGEFTYWVKVNLKEILAKKFLLKNIYNSDYVKDNENGLNLFLKFYGNNESYKLSLDRKNSLNKFKNNIKQEGISLKTIIREEFNLSKKDNALSLDSINSKLINKVDTNHNKNKKIPFKIEWDEIDSTKIF